MRRDGGEQLARALQALPIFPLPHTVFFPHTLLPLHVFEPRYRELIEHVLASHMHLAVVCQDPSRVDVAVPGVAQVSGVGRIMHHERLADGRFHLLLQGIARVELVEELPLDSLLYRRCAAKLLDAEHEPREADTDAEVQLLRSCYARLLEVCPTSKDTLGDLPLRVSQARVLADVVCAAVLEDVSARQAALAETSVVRRLKLASDALATLLLRGLATDSAAMQ